MSWGITLVVLIDDLDRCLTETIISTLEAIRLFLLPKNTAFVIAADNDMIILITGHPEEVWRERATWPGSSKSRSFRNCCSIGSNGFLDQRTPSNRRDAATSPASLTAPM